jgi:hypothetical protein
MANLETLAGRHIVSAHFDKATGFVELVSNDPIPYHSLTKVHIIRLMPECDCCSHCYIQHVSGADTLQNATIASVETLETRTENDPDGDVLDVWGHRITTNKGTCTIEMRLVHNGYYSGQFVLSAFLNETSDAPLLEDFSMTRAIAQSSKIDMPTLAPFPPPLKKLPGFLTAAWVQA